MGLILPKDFTDEERETFSAIIGPTMPTPGQPRGGEELDLQNAVQALLNEFNGNIDTDNMKPAAGLKPTQMGVGTNGLAQGTMAAQSPTAARGINAWNKVAGVWTAFYNIGTWFNAALGRYTPQIPGYYRVSGGIEYVRIANGANNVYGQGLAGVGKNGAPPSGPSSIGSTPIMGRLAGNLHAGFSTIYQMNGSTDFLELFSYLDSDTGALNGTGYLTIDFIGRS